MSAMPYAVMPVDTTENRKNFKAASALRASSRRNPTSTKAGRETTSRAINRLNRSRDAESTSMPLTDHSNRAWYSPGGIRSSPTAASEVRRTTTSTARNSSWKYIAKSSATYEQPSGRQKVLRVDPVASHAAAPRDASVPRIDSVNATDRRAA